LSENSVLLMIFSPSGTKIAPALYMSTSLERTGLGNGRFLYGVSYWKYFICRLSSILTLLNKFVETLKDIKYNYYQNLNSTV
jgi:hypothetical protein